MIQINNYQINLEELGPKEKTIAMKSLWCNDNRIGRPCLLNAMKDNSCPYAHSLLEKSQATKQSDLIF